MGSNTKNIEIILNSLEITKNKNNNWGKITCNHDCSYSAIKNIENYINEKSDQPAILCKKSNYLKNESYA